MIKINASIVLYNNKYNQLQKVIEGILPFVSLNKLYLIDNSLTDKLKGYVKISNKIEYIFNNKNVGYGAGHNIAIRKTIEDQIDYHIVLNPDVYFESSAIAGLVEYVENHKDVGLIMPKILYPNEETQFLAKLLPTPLDLFVRRFLPSFFNKYKEKRNNIYELRFTGYNKIMQVPNLSGCFMLLRTKTLEEVGLFDENIFMYLEDTDLSRRIHSKYKTIFFPAVQIYHEYSRASYKSIKLMLYHIQAAVYYFNKYGWFFDKERDIINKQVIDRIKKQL